MQGEVVERPRVTDARKGTRCVPSLLFSSITLGSTDSRVIFLCVYLGTVETVFKVACILNSMTRVTKR